MCYLTSFIIFEDNRHRTCRRSGQVKGLFIPQMISYFDSQSSHQKLTIMLISTAELPELYILTNSCIEAERK